MRNDIKDVVQGVLAGKEDVQHYHYGILGWNGVVEVANQPGYVYVTLSDGMVTQVYNQIAPIILNFPVVVGYDTRQTNKHLLSVVACRGIPRINVNNPGNLVTREHAATHEWMNPNGGQDVLFVHLRQFMPLRPEPSGGMSLYVERDVQPISNVWKQVGGTTLDLSSYVPTTYTYSTTGDETFVLITLSLTSGSLVVTASGSSCAVGSITPAYIPATPTKQFPICAVRLYTGQTEIIEATNGTDLVDLRLSDLTYLTTPALSDLSDVSIATLAPADTLIYDFVARKWKNDGAFPAMNQPHGVLSRAQSTVTYTSGSQVISVAPVSGSWVYYNAGVKHVQTATLTATHTNATGTYYCYIKGSDNSFYFGATAHSIITDIQIAIVYYSASDTPKGWVTEERHETSLSPEAHYEFHYTVGAYWNGDGLALSNYSLQPSSPAGNVNKWIVSSGVIHDEDIDFTTAASGSASYNYMYRSGVAGDWLWNTAQADPYKFTVGGYINANTLTSGSWVNTQLANGEYVNYYVLVTDSLNTGLQVWSIPGQTVHATLASAQAETLASFSWGSFSIVEAVAAYQITYRAGASYTTAGQCRIEAVSDLRRSNLRASVQGSASISNHNALSGLQGGAAGQYYHLTSAQLTIATTAASGSNAGYLTAADWTKFNSSGSGGGGGGGHVIQGAGTPFTQRANLNFTGAAVTVSDDAGNNATVVAISASGSAGGGGDVLASGSTVDGHIAVWNGNNKTIRDGAIASNILLQVSGSLVAGHLIVASGSSSNLAKDGGTVPSGSGSPALNVYLNRSFI